MMIAPYDETRWFVVPQAEHSRVAGQLAAHWGNATFARPTPYAALVLAAQEHDQGGWWDVELRPALSAAGEPLDYTATIGYLGPRWLESWGRGVEQVARHDAYAALMILIHGVGILTRGYGLLPRLPAYAADPAVAAFVAGQEARRAELLAEVRQDPALRDAATDAHLWVNYRLLEAFDQLAQILCNRYPLTDTSRHHGATRTLTDVPIPVAPGQPDAAMCIDALDAGRAVVQPYPFDAEPLEVAFVARLLPRRPYASSDDYLAEYLRAPRLPITYTLHAR